MRRKSNLLIFFVCAATTLPKTIFFGWWPCSHQPPFVVSVTLPVKLPCIVRNRNWAQNNKDLQKNRKSYNILLLSTFSKRCTKHSSWNDRKQSMVFSQLLLKGESSRESQPFGMLWQFRSNDFFFLLSCHIWKVAREEHFTQDLNFFLNFLSTISSWQKPHHAIWYVLFIVIADFCPFSRNLDLMLCW